MDHTFFVINKNARNIRCVSLKGSADILFEFNDVLARIFPYTNWPDETKRNKLKYYRSLFTSNQLFSLCFYTELFPTIYINKISVKYLLHDLLLKKDISHESYNDILLLQEISSSHEKSKSYTESDLLLPPSHFLFEEKLSRQKQFTDQEKNRLFNNDCNRLNFKTEAEKIWYCKLLSDLCDLMPRINKIIEKEIAFMSSRIDFCYREVDIKEEYRLNTSWALKLFIELTTADRTKSPNSNVKTKHDLKKSMQRYFALQLMFHIRNATFSSPFTMNISDIFYTRHSDVNYAFNMTSHLGITQALSTVRRRQNSVAINRDVNLELKTFEPCSWTYIYDNFNKTHGSHSSIYGDKQTNSIELINRAAISLPSPKPCPDLRCKNKCIESCLWGKEKHHKIITFNKIYIDQEESVETEKYRSEKVMAFFKDTIKIFHPLQKLKNLTKSVEQIPFDDTDFPELNTTTTSIDLHLLTQADINLLIEDTKKLLKHRKEIRALYYVKTSNIPATRITLPSVPGKDTDPAVSYEILEATRTLFFDRNHPDEAKRIFIGGDQKTMSLAMRLKRQSDNFNHIYVTIPDLHFRKSFMHSIFSQYEDLGLRHLAKLSGYVNSTQWDYLKNTCSIHKSFEFIERLSECLRITLTFEFIEYLTKNHNFNVKEYISNGYQLNNNIENIYTEFVSKSNDKTFQKNIDLLEACEIIVMHHAAERTRNWDLRTAVLKNSLHFAMISNCTQYGPLLIELLFHQESFQERYIDLMRAGHFTNKLRDYEHSAHVGNDAQIEDVNLLAGQFRHKRQSLDEAIIQSNSIDILQKQQVNFDKNLLLKNKNTEPTYKDDRETKLLIIRALLNFDSFKKLDRSLINEFSTEKTTFNEELLKVNWYPVADYLVRRYIQNNSSIPICNVESATQPSLVLPQASQNLLTRIKKSTSVVIKIKSHLPAKTANLDVRIKRKAKEIVNKLQWESSTFEDAAAICNFDGSKMSTNKASFKLAVRELFGNEIKPKGENTRNNDIVTLNQTEWLSDVQLNLCININKVETINKSVTIFYPLPTETLAEIFKTNSNVFRKVIDNKHHCIIPLNTGSHWIALFINGSQRKIYYLDSFGNQPSSKLKVLLNHRFIDWDVLCNSIQLQNDSYQCGVWCCFFVQIYLQYVNTVDETQNIQSFIAFFQASLNSKQIKDVKTLNENSNFIYEFRNTLSLKMKTIQHNSIDENLEEKISAQKPNTTNMIFFRTAIPKDINFNIVSVDSQHTLWSKPNASTGPEYIKFLGKRYFDKYFIAYNANKLYWNYDLYELSKSNIPKAHEQAKRDKTTLSKLEFCENRLLCNDDIITKDFIIQDWDEVKNSRSNRNKVANYVGMNCENYKLPPNKELIINSESTTIDDKVIPQIYCNQNKKVIKLNANELKNAFFEGEGSAVAHLSKHINTDNCLVVSNDSDALLYCLLAGIQRKRCDKKFNKELWLEIVYTSCKTGISGTKKNITSEFWDINNLIYTIETKLPTIQNAVLSVVIIYLAAGSDYTEKWFSKTHKTFLKSYIENIHYIGDLVSESSTNSLNSNAYRKLIHCIWNGKGDPTKTNFHELRQKTKRRINIRLHLPEENVLLQHFKRVSGVYKYMLSYILDIPCIDWSKYGFYFDKATKRYYPSIYITEIHDEIKSKADNLQATKKVEVERKRISADQAGMLEAEFRNNKYLDNSNVKNLTVSTGMNKIQLQKWFSRKRRITKDDKENQPPAKLTRIRN